MLYLDNPATTKIKPVSVWASLIYNNVFNSINAGRGSHRYSIHGAELVSKTAENLADLFNIKNPERIIFTQNATYALNFAIGGILKQGGHAIVTSMEHNSVLRPVHSFGNYTIVYADESGLINPSDIENAIREDTKLIVCTHASNVCGTIQPIGKIGKIARKHNLVFLVDAAQTAGVVNIDVEKMNIDMLAFSGHKGLLGPLGTGGLYVGERAEIEPIISGGTGSVSENLEQPKNFPDVLQVGTVNTPSVAALSKGVDFVKRTDILKHERKLASEFIECIDEFPQIRVLGTKDMSKRNGTVAFCVGDRDSAEISEMLDKKYHIATRGGWHCAYFAHKTLNSQKHGAVRVGFGWNNTEKDVLKLIRAIYKIV